MEIPYHYNIEVKIEAVGLLDDLYDLLDTWDYLTTCLLNQLYSLEAEHHKSDVAITH